LRIVTRSLPRKGAVLGWGIPAAIVLTLSARAADCDGNGVEDAIDVAPSGPGYRLVRRVELASKPTDIVLSDMNGDGKADILAIDSIEGELLVALGKGDWRWEEPGIEPLRPGQDLFLVADLDRDGRPDVVTASSQGLSFFFNAGNGDLEPAPGEDVRILSGVNGLASADVDGDGWIDVVTANRFDNVSVVRNAGGRSFEAPRNHASGISGLYRPQRVVAGDLDRDGHIDLALAMGENTPRATISVLWNDDRGAYPDVSTWKRNWLSFGFLGYEDIDDDGGGDLIFSTGGSILALRNEGARILSDFVISWGKSVPLGPVLLEDLDLDGRAELAFSRQSCDGFVVASRQGGTYADAMTFPAHGTYYGFLRAGDLDSDGDRDLVLFEPHRSRIHLFAREAALASGDCDENGVPDACEDDCNANGIADACDLGTETSADCDGNGVPDECDPDCNTNLLPDVCEIRDGIAGDCDRNGVPDTCDFPDSNGNGVPDGCEIASGSGGDCNGNGILDEVEAAAHHLLPPAIATPYGKSLSTADLDGDGSAEILFTSSNGIPELSIRRGTAGPPLASSSFGVGTGGRIRFGESVTPLDLDADGDPDLAVLSMTADCNARVGLAIVENLGWARLRYARWRRFPAPARPDSILAGDLDGDAFPDLVAWGEAAQLWLLRGGPGAPEAPRLFFSDQEPAFHDVASIDIESDGDLDLVTNTGAIFTNPGDAGFFADGSLPPANRAVRFVEVIDVGADGVDDLILGNSLLENRGGRNFLETTLTEREVYGAARDDFDGDGLEDAVLGLEAGKGVYLQRGGGFLVTHYPQAAYGSMVAVDANTDGRPDLATLDQAGLVIHLNLADPPFGTLGRWVGEGHVVSLVGRDLDGDGDMDLAGTIGEDSGRLTLHLWLGDGAGGLVPSAPSVLGETIFDGVAHDLAARDLDADGDTDFIVAARREFLVLERGAAGLTRVPVPGAPATVEHATVLDLDGDGREDLTLQGARGEVSVLLGAGWPSFETVYSVILGSNPGRGISSTDLDGDGDPDLVATISAGVLPIANLGGRSFSQGPAVIPGGEADGSATADFDGDGDVDVAVSHCKGIFDCEGGPLLTVFGGDGQGSFREPISRFATHLSRELEAVDLDADGDVDIAASQGFHSQTLFLTMADSVWMLLNGGRGELRSASLVRPGTFPGPIEIADLDGDGVLDLAVGSKVGLADIPLEVLPPRELDADGDGILDSCPQVPFRRGDWNADGRVDLTDAVALLGRLFLGGATTGCDDSGDADDDGKLDLADPLRLLRHLFQGEAAPPPPEVCGQDPTADRLSCAGRTGC
jgi:hypothetical protein